MPQKKLLFLTLNTFSSTGGIEKVCRIAGKALYEIGTEGGYRFAMFSMYDQPGQVMANYIPASVYTAFSGRRLSFVKQAVVSGRQSEIVLLAHVNLLVVGALIKILSPRTKVVLTAHGIEVWKPFPGWKKRLLRMIDKILPVSSFTQERMQALYGLPASRFTVVNNCLDPFLPPKPRNLQPNDICKRFGFGQQDVLLFTLTRISSSEQYKGYDKVIAALPEILKHCPSTKYLIAGKYDAAEKERLDGLIAEKGVQDKVVFTGFVSDEDLPGLFRAADVYIMPSSGEGFGIVFIEALYYGLPVIAGNVDGSVDAVDRGRLGKLVNPEDAAQIVTTAVALLDNKERYIPNATAVWEKFGYPTYKNHLQIALEIKKRRVQPLKF